MNVYEIQLSLFLNPSRKFMLINLYMNTCMYNYHKIQLEYNTNVFVLLLYFLKRVINAALRKRDLAYLERTTFSAK